MSAASAALRGFVRSRAGISLGADKDYLVISRLEPQLAGWGMSSLDSLAEAVRRQPTGALANQVVAALTTNETLFFRDSRPFEALRTLVLPEATASGSLAIWSAACSTGQEVYSIAMVLQDDPRASGCRVSILGSDISEPALARARAGVYSSFEVQRGLTPAMLARHFEAHGDGWRVRQALRANTSFRSLNLLDLPPGLGPFDVVFCRNVLIYFEVDVKERVLAGIAARMRPGGWLFLGGAETTMGLSANFTPVPGTTGLYRRAGGASTPAEPERRMFGRMAADIACDLVLDGTRVPGRLIEISMGGARVAGSFNCRPGATGELTVAAHGLKVPFRVAARNDDSLGLAFPITIKLPPGLVPGYVP